MRGARGRSLSGLVRSAACPARIRRPATLTPGARPGWTTAASPKVSSKIVLALESYFGQLPRQVPDEQPPDDPRPIEGSDSDSE
jgi:hypothetical protein